MGASLGSEKSQNRWKAVEGSLPEHCTPMALGGVTQRGFPHQEHRRRASGKKLFVSGLG